MSQNEWRRVSRAELCPVCQRHDWCLVSRDGDVAICPRAESGRRCGEAGWLHRLRDEPRRDRRWVRSFRLRSTAPTRADHGLLAQEYQRTLDPARLGAFARSLGLSVESLSALCVGWSQQFGAWSFPMSDPGGRVLGIRLRRPDGSKFAVRGGKEGLFLPALDPADADPLLITEGPTDCAALLDLGYRNVAGRPSCSGGIKLLVELARQRQPREVIVVTDGDGPGRCGADNLASVLLAYVTAVRVIEPPSGIKDVRAWVRAGGKRADMDKAIEGAPVRRLAIRIAPIRNETAKLRT